MERLTEYHSGVAVIKNKNMLSEAMKKLAAYEDAEERKINPGDPSLWKNIFPDRV